MKNVTRLEDVPQAHKVAVYDAICAHFAARLDGYYDDDGAPRDPRYDSGVVSPDDPPTHCIGFRLETDGSLFVVMNVKGWADLLGFSVYLPDLDRRDMQDDGAVLELAAEGGQDE